MVWDPEHKRPHVALVYSGEQPSRPTEELLLDYTFETYWKTQVWLGKQLGVWVVMAARLFERPLWEPAGRIHLLQLPLAACLPTGGQGAGGARAVRHAGGRGALRLLSLLWSTSTLPSTAVGPAF